MWAGSVVNSMMPLLVGTAATGKFSAGVEFSTALNAPYAIIPIVLCISLFGDKATLAKRRRGATASVGGGGAFVCMLAASHAALVLLHTVQLMAVLGSDAEVAQHWREEVEPVLQQPDKTNVLLIQSVQYFYFLGLYHCFALWEIYHRWRHATRSVLGNAADWSALGLGAYLQGMWIQLFMASAEYTSPGNIRIVWGGASEHQLTVALAVVGAALAQCWAYHRWD